MNLVQQLADLSAGLVFEDLPGEVVERAKISIIDTIGVGLAGSGDHAAQIIEQVLLGPGPIDEPGSWATLLGLRRRARPLDAAIINGTSIHAMDFDSINSTFAGHPSIHLLPPLLALAESRRASGKALITAFVAGWETQARLGRLANPELFRRGWYPTGTLGVIGAAAGCARLLELDPATTAQAISISAMFASGVMAHAGTMTKPLAAGVAGYHGLLSALSAQAGMTGALDALTDRRGFLALFAGHSGPAHLPEGAPVYDLLASEPGIKQYPCCAVFHAALDVLVALQAEHGFGADQVTQLEGKLQTARFDHVNRPDPQSDVDAKFSTQYCLARTLMGGRPRFEDFEHDAYRDAKTRAVMDRIAVTVHPDTGQAGRRDGGAEVVVTLRDGRQLSGRTERAVDIAAGTPISPERLRGKFTDCALRVLPDDQVGRVFDALKDLDKAPSILAITEALVRRD